MKTLMRRFDERGVAAAEFALLLPALLLILIGTIEFGMIMYGREVVTNAAREGARAGIVQGPPKRSEGEIINIAETYLTNTGINSANVTFTVTGEGSVSPNNLTVQATYLYNFLFPYLPMMVGISNPLNIQTQVVMRHE
jgi:Flp pilus assembly protein TadG